MYELHEVDLMGRLQRIGLRIIENILRGGRNVKITYSRGGTENQIRLYILRQNMYILSYKVLFLGFAIYSICLKMGLLF